MVKNSIFFILIPKCSCIFSQAQFIILGGNFKVLDLYFLRIHNPQERVKPSFSYFSSSWKTFRDPTKINFLFPLSQFPDFPILLIYSSKMEIFLAGKVIFDVSDKTENEFIIRLGIFEAPDRSRCAVIWIGMIFFWWLVNFKLYRKKNYSKKRHFCWKSEF